MYDEQKKQWNISRQVKVIFYYAHEYVYFYAFMLELQLYVF